VKRTLLLLAVTFGAIAAAPQTQQEIASAEHGRAFSPALAAALDGDPAVAARAALAIGRTLDPAGAPVLRAHVGATDPAVRAMVIYGLGLLTDRTAIPVITTLGRGDTNSAVRYAAADALGRIAAAAPAQTTQLASTLLAMARGDRDVVVRAHAAANLDPFRTTTVAQHVAFALQSAFRHESDRDVRWHEMWTLARAYAKLSSPAFFKGALADPDDTVRLLAVKAIGRQGDRNAVPVVRPLLDDPSWRVQEEATEALRVLDGKPLTEHLAALQPGLHLPPVKTLPEDAVAPLPRPPATGKPKAPSLDDVLFTPSIYPTSANLMNGPMPGPHPRVRVTTTQGTFVLRLYPEWAPFTVANFLNLANAGYFDGNRWFRVVPDFVVQTGDQTNTGDGDPGFTIGAEENPVEQRSGIISMGLDYKNDKPVRDSAGSQFYLTLSPQLHLDRSFTVFGEVQSGFDVLPRIVENDKMVRVEQISNG